MRRLPLRVRLVAGFSVVMLAVIATADAYVYLRVQRALDDSLNRDLDVVSEVLAGEVEEAGAVLDADFAAARGGIFQVIGADGSVLQRSSGAPDAPLVPRADLGERPTLVEQGDLLNSTPDPRRALVTPVVTDSQPVWLVVSLRRIRRDEALRELMLAMVLATVAALVLTGFVGNRLARSALAPVERYRRRAEEISQGATGVRLDVPDERDDEVTRLGHTLNDMLEALDRALASERRFVDDASHELRTPLTVLMSRLQLAQRRPRTVAEHEANLAELAEDVERLRRLADELLDLRRPVGGTTEDAGAVVVAVTREHAPSATLEVPADPVAVAMDEAALRRVLTNVLTNARLHGGEPISVTLTRRRTDVRVVVTDGGPGMAPDFLPRAHERFARADDARPRPGSGLGLSIVTELVERAGGAVHLANAAPPASGLVVTVDLPAWSGLSGPEEAGGPAASSPPRR